MPKLMGRRNNSKITICCATVSDLLRRERQYANGGVVDEMYVSRDIDRPASRRGKIPRLPEKGSILLMMGGVPWLVILACLIVTFALNN